METFGLKPCKAVGDIKTAVKDAILDGDIPNNYDAAFAYMLEKGKEMNLEPQVKWVCSGQLAMGSWQFAMS